MRDIALFLLITAALPLAMIRPWVGILMWSWISFMNPHRISFGFATDMPWGMMIAMATIMGCFFAREPKRIFSGATAKLIMAFVAATAVTSLLALSQSDDFYTRWSQNNKMFLMLLLTLGLATTRVRIQSLVWIIVISVGYFGVKGGAFALTTGGSFRVYGPPGSAINDNNSCAAALLAILPFIFYLYQQTADKRMRIGLVGAMILTTFAIVSTQSRGALIGLLAGAGFLWLKTPNKLISGLAILLMLAIVASFMPASWYERMQTISTYADTDDIANNRLFLWETGWKLALARPLTGVGYYGTYDPWVVARYVPGAIARSLHSVWFETLAEHGFPTFFIWLALPVVAWFNASHILRKGVAHADLRWAVDLARMGQVSVIAFLVAGTFLPLMYYDVYFTILAVIAAARRFVDDRLSETTDERQVAPWRRMARGGLLAPAQRPQIVQ